MTDTARLAKEALPILKGYVDKFQAIHDDLENDGDEDMEDVLQETGSLLSDLNSALATLEGLSRDDDDDD